MYCCNEKTFEKWKMDVQVIAIQFTWFSNWLCCDGSRFQLIMFIYFVLLQWQLQSYYVLRIPRNNRLRPFQLGNYILLSHIFSLFNFGANRVGWQWMAGGKGCIYVCIYTSIRLYIYMPVVIVERSGPGMNMQTTICKHHNSNTRRKQKGIKGDVWEKKTGRRKENNVGSS